MQVGEFLASKIVNHFGLDKVVQQLSDRKAEGYLTTVPKIGPKLAATIKAGWDANPNKGAAKVRWPAGLVLLPRQRVSELRCKLMPLRAGWSGTPTHGHC